MANNSNAAAAQLPQQFQYPPNFYDLHASSFYARHFHASQMPFSPFDPQHPYFSQNPSSNQHQLEPLNRLALSLPNRLITSFFRHRGELALHEKYRYDLSKSQLKASSRTSALLAGFAMVGFRILYEKGIFNS